MLYEIYGVVSVVANGTALTSNKGCSDKLMSYTNKGGKGQERAPAQTC
jgi:hypothetical protein